MLSPLLNIGLLTPAEVVDAALDFAATENIALNNVEGFVRQIIGWREFMFGIYRTDGERLRSGNFWRHRRRLTGDWYRGTTGLLPLDHVIRKAERIGWAHHIERLNRRQLAARVVSRATPQLRLALAIPHGVAIQLRRNAMRLLSGAPFLADGPSPSDPRMPLRRILCVHKRADGNRLRHIPRHALIRFSGPVRSSARRSLLGFDGKDMRRARPGAFFRALLRED